ncbi:uncharacterized protein UV8b_07746 [Ustilaginoidea virens]|uniref:Uncharacterized protein n=1 Tax=Ustilaginoidea virens TaxID=1159556 RepID=A0A063BUI2_USTVR|nr:uncharacterized protein UV8b_07746 [Ustilaginoidea virens]QUC23505.1 hypothetical protein UV8b_07746 [Ustilaginoidea virens]GAO15862.1 hypothetical protein UVI_02051570 [Ustilaginoidea virens]
MASVTLQSRDHRGLLDIIDKLRSQGISRYVDIPQIIVCGDQSAGKSSVLEAISGMSFPAKDNLCTRFPTELILRRHATSTVKVSINPGPDRSEQDRGRLAEFKAEIHDTPDIGDVVEKAKQAMGLSDTKVFSSDILRVEVCGPTQPHLTMVDLPGLFRAGSREQSVQDAAVVRKMVRGYMESPRSIILAVVSAKSDFALQDITELAREVDPRGVRTLGLITKPDALDVGSDSEIAYLKLAQNKDVVFRLGWHVLKNRDFKTRDATSAERDEAEEAFFSKGVWTSMDPSLLGVKSLKPRLSNVLKDQILQQLPDLLQDVDAEMAACEAQLRRLGTPRGTLKEQRKYLLLVSRDFTSLMQAAIDGEYSDPFFGDAQTEAGYRKRLRARVRNTLTAFQQEMCLKGESKRIVDDASDTENKEQSSRRISRSAYIDHVNVLMSRMRARELQGTFNPLIISELFAEQCQPWSGIAEDVMGSVLQIVDDVTRAIVDHIAIEEAANGIFCIISSSLDGLKGDLHAKLQELLRPHLQGHPITYNNYVINIVQKAQAARRHGRLENVLKKVLGRDDLQAGNETSFDPYQLLKSLEEETDDDMNQHASESAIDYMQAYYKVALERFVDDVSVLAVEQCLVSKLPSLLQSDVVLDLEEEEIARLVSESQDTSLQRARCLEKLDVLQKGKEELRRLVSQRSLGLGAHSGSSQVGDQEANSQELVVPEANDGNGEEANDGNGEEANDGDEEKTIVG